MANKDLKIKSISTNYFLYNFRTIIDILIPLIIFPYITRILGPENLGKVSFAESIMGYFLIFSQLGIPAFGVREIARVRDDVNERSRVFWELSLFLLITTLISIIAYFILILYTPKFNLNLLLYLVILPNLFFTNFNYEWFYTGIEDQVFITVRYIIVKVLQCLLIFTLIKDSNQYVLYAAILVGMNSISALFNIFHIHKFIIRVPFIHLKFNRHLKYIFAIFASAVGIQINRVLDITMIGVMMDDASVSLYVVANRIVMIIRSLILGIVFAVNPRVENVFKSGETNLYKKFINYSLHYMLLLSIPATAAILVMAPEIIFVIAGNQYFGSILAMRLLSPIMIIVGISNIIVSLILYPHRDEDKYTIVVAISSVANFIFNFLMIPIIGYYGAIIGTVIAEFLAFCLSTYFAKRYLKEGIIELIYAELIKYIVSTILMVFFLLVLKKNIANYHCLLIISVMAGIFIYAVSLLLLRSKFAVILLHKGKNMLNQNNSRGNYDK